jgi:N-carbamoylputrescine amidase
MGHGHRRRVRRARRQAPVRRAGFCTPDGRIHIYRKRNLVFWERSRFRPGGGPLVVPTRWGRIGFAICADMIYRRVWRDYRGRSTWRWSRPPGRISPTARPAGRTGCWAGSGRFGGEIPRRVATDLDIPVIFANQCGRTQTVIPVLGGRIPDQFAGRSSLCDGRRALPVHAGVEEEVLIASLTPSPRGTSPCGSTSHSAHSVSFSGSVR